MYTNFRIGHATISSSQIVTIVALSEDTDLLILLLHHAKNNGFKLYFRRDIKRRLSCCGVIFITFCAFTSSGGTSGLFRFRKSTALETLMKDK